MWLALVRVGFAPWEQPDPRARLLGRASFLQIWIDGRDPGQYLDIQKESERASLEEDDHSLLQLRWKGAETLAVTKLPPPGNPVHFEPWVEVTEDDQNSGFYDHQCDNDFWLGLVQETSMVDNHFLHAFLKPETCTPEPVSMDVPVREIRLSASLSQQYLPTIKPLVAQCEGLDFAGALTFGQWLYGHVCLPTSDNYLPWHPSSIEWAHLPIWASEEPSEICFYVDGSRGNQGVGAACTMFAKVGACWLWGGHLLQHLEDEASPYQAEVAAHVMAAKSAK